ncbi:hypothetical protein HAZT_HAZT012221 [Hyalella azteca]|uniref:P-type ATPase N-terminal domain-containing protein n=1 Tax=Hyalella azteca TaxID=294128 RepID=A0A6A0H8W0_HYAAZ|nr:hypothetical protein HAZT_HAZT012221 [Hyalella azteca]
MEAGNGVGADIPSSSGDIDPPGGRVGKAKRTHARSASHGGTVWSYEPSVPYSPFDTRRGKFTYLPSGEPQPTGNSPAVGGGWTHGAEAASTPPHKSVMAGVSPQQSILMNPSTEEVVSQKQGHVRTHHRTFSHGQTVDGVTGPHHRGHKRAGSRTDFILPAGHEQRERERRQAAAKPSLGRTSSFPLGGHKRNASKTESIYTIRENKMSLYQRLLSLVGRSLPAEQATRTVVVNHTLQPDNATNPNASHPSNRVTTTKYNLVTFIPKNLFEQFHRFANIYFLFIVLLNFVPSINAFAKEVAMLPLLFVLSVTALKDLFEDRRRYNSDKRVNNSSCRVYCRLVARLR